MSSRYDFVNQRKIKIKSNNKRKITLSVSSFEIRLRPYPVTKYLHKGFQIFRTSFNRLLLSSRVSLMGGILFLKISGENSSCEKKKICDETSEISESMPDL